MEPGGVDNFHAEGRLNALKVRLLSAREQRQSSRQRCKDEG